MPPLSRALRVARRAPRWSTTQGFVAGLILGVCITTVLAAQMSFSATSLGTGSVSVTACDSSIAVDIGHGYQSASTRFTVSSLTLMSVDVACAAKTLVLIGYSGTVSTLAITTVLPSAASWPTGSAFTLAPGAVIASGGVTSTAVEIRD